VRIDNRRGPGGKLRPPVSDADLFVLLGVGCAGFAATLGGVLTGGLIGFLIGTAGLCATLGAAGIFGMAAVRALLPPNGS
jgi:hypothetical protein